MAKQNGTRVITNKVRFLYTHLFDKYTNKLSGKSAYSTTVLIPKDDVETIDAIKNAIKVAMDEGKSRGIAFGKTLSHPPLRDGDNDRPDDANYANCYFMNLSSQYQPDVVDRRGNRIENPDEVYSGMYGRVSMNFFSYSAAGNKGISAGLGNVQKLEDGDRLGGRSSARSDFEDSIDNGDGDSDEDTTLPF